MSASRAFSAAGVAAASCLIAAGLVVGPTAPAFADDVGCDQVSTDNLAPASTSESKPLTEMDAVAAQQFLTTRGGQAAAGSGVNVAVLDSGVSPAAGIPVVATIVAGATLPDPTYYHGTDIAGLIAGPARSDGSGAVGIAPGVGIVDVRVYDDPDSTGESGAPITPANVLAGLQQVLAQAATLDIKVVAIPLEVEYLDGMQDVIDQLWAAGVVVVAPAGNRPQDGSTGPLPTSFVSPSAGEDAADSVYPAHYDHVLVAGSSLTGLEGDASAQTYLLQNSDVQVATPTALSVSYSVVGGTCVNSLPATSWATAYVAGALALDQSYFDETPAQAVSRLLNTANGRSDIPNETVGAGEVQPLVALTRPLSMDAAGKVLDAPVAETKPQVVRAPTTPPDVLASTRRNAVWWGIGGGGALLIALMLRPVLARRRQSVDGL